MYKAIEIVDPVVKVVRVIFIAEISGLRGSTGQSIRTVDLTGNVAQLETESKNGDYPAVNTGRRSCIGVI